MVSLFPEFHFKVDQYSVLNGLIHDVSAVKNSKNGTIMFL